jgi:hypothetical protein
MDQAEPWGPAPERCLARLETWLAVAVTADGETIFSAGEDASLRYWDIQDRFTTEWYRL